jgi:hypothetical protein
MPRDFKMRAFGCVSALALMGATAGTANAYYLGYGNADPGNWDFWTEQRGGPAPQSPTQGAKSANMDIGSCNYLHEKALETGKPHWWHRYHACKAG